MRKLSLSLMCICWGFMVHCAADHKATQSTSLPQERCEAPLWNEGDTWKFQLEDRRSWEDRVAKVEKDFYILDSKGKYMYGYDKKTLQVRIYIDSEGRRGIQQPDSSIFFDFPLYVGKKWAKVIDGRTTEGTHSNQLYAFRVMSFEEVTVPAGTFKAFRIEREGSVVGTNRSFTTDIWYAPEAKNIIKLKFSSYGFGTWQISAQNCVLIGYKLAP